MQYKFFGKDFTLSGQTFSYAFWLLIAAAFVIGIFRELVVSQLPYVDVDWKVEAPVAENARVIPVDEIETWDAKKRATPAGRDPVSSVLKGIGQPGAVMTPHLQLPIPLAMGQCRFYLGADTSRVYCSGAVDFPVHWSNRTYATGGIFLDLSESLENTFPLQPLDTLNRLSTSGTFTFGPGPRIAGYEQLSSNRFRHVVGELIDPVKQRSSISYARNSDWLSFPSKFPPPHPDPNGPWSVYEDESLYPWLGTDLLNSLPPGRFTSAALTHVIDFEDFPFEWKRRPAAHEYEWVVPETAWKISALKVVESYTNYQAGVVVASLLSSRGQPVLALFACHDGRLLAIRAFSFGDVGSTARKFIRVGFSPDGWMFAAFDNRGELYFFHTKTLELLRHYREVDGRPSSSRKVRMAFNSRGDKFIAPVRNSGDLAEVDIINDRVIGLDCPDPVSAYAYATSYDSIDTLMTVSAVSGRVIKYRLDNGTADREEKYLLAGLHPDTKLNFSKAGNYLLGTISEATAGIRPPEGKTAKETISRLMVWDLSTSHYLDPVPATSGSWQLSNGKLVDGDFVKLDRRTDGFHVLVNAPQGLIEIPSSYLTTKAIDRALLLSSVVRPPAFLNHSASDVGGE